MYKTVCNAGMYFKIAHIDNSPHHCRAKLEENVVCLHIWFFSMRIFGYICVAYVNLLSEIEQYIYGYDEPIYNTIV